MEQKKKGLNISAKSFIGALAVILVLMIVSYILTFLIPSGLYARITDANGDKVVDTSVAFRYVEGGIPFWKWLLSPILVLGAEGGSTIIGILVFLFVIGGIFTGLEACGITETLLRKIVCVFGRSKYHLMAVIILFFMLLGSLIGTYEECVPLVPLVVGVAISLNWDAFTGLGMSILAAGFGFAAGVFNPFTVGVAQGLARVPMFSGAWLRIVSFVLIYGLLFFFIVKYAKKTEKARGEKMPVAAEEEPVKGSIKIFLSGFFKGIVSVLPVIPMILMASSIRYILEEARILDTILHYAVVSADKLPEWSIILFVYLIVLVMNFFIASGSAKAFLLIPLVVPMAQMFGVSAQLCVLAFAFGDGFSNTFYPTNPVLLISLGLADVSYGTWVKRTWKLQVATILLTSCILLFGLVIGY